jgi:hypothetical protein
MDPEMTGVATNTDPEVIRVLLHYREAIARETEKAYRELASLGVSEPAEHLPRRPTRPRQRGTVLPR